MHSIRNSFFFTAFVTLLSVAQCLDAVTLVYSMKIRRVFSASAIKAALDQKKKLSWLASALPIVYTRDRHVQDASLGINFYDNRLVGGAIINFRYIPSRDWWFELTTGIEKERAEIKGSSKLCASRTGLDDIVLDVGHNTFFGENTQLVVYGLAGFPTKTSVSLQDAQDTLVGTRFFSLGAGAELSYSFINKIDQSLIGIIQARFLHFFTRKWYPILPCSDKIQPGNVTDLLVSLQYRIKREILEAGTNPSFFTNQAVLLKNSKVKADNFVRNSFYMNYSHLCKRISFFKNPLLIGTGFSVARSDRFNTKILAWWLNITTAF